MEAKIERTYHNSGYCSLLAPNRMVCHGSAREYEALACLPAARDNPNFGASVGFDESSQWQISRVGNGAKMKVSQSSSSKVERCVTGWNLSFIIKFVIRAEFHAHAICQLFNDAHASPEKAWSESCERLLEAAFFGKVNFCRPP